MWAVRIARHAMVTPATTRTDVFINRFMLTSMFPASARNIEAPRVAVFGKTLEFHVFSMAARRRVGILRSLIGLSK